MLAQRLLVDVEPLGDVCLSEAEGGGVLNEGALGIGRSKHI
jgi:hypothetical protein